MQKSRLRYAVLSTALLAASVFAAAPQGAKLADEPIVSRFTLTSSATVSFVRDGVFTEKTLPAASYDCKAETFGLTSTAAASRGTCSYTLANGGVVVVAPPTPTYGKVADEGGTFTLAAASNVRFGYQTVNEGRWFVKALPAGPNTCNLATFGTDPWPGMGKVCETTADPVSTPPAPTQPAVSSFVAGQGGTFTLTTTTAIKFGNQGQFFQKTLLPNTYTCEDSFFGDPLVGLNKSCYLVGSDAPQPPQSTNRAGTGETGTTPTNPTTPPVVTNPPATGDAAWLAQANSMHTLQGLEYRFGKKSTKVQTLPTWEEPEHKLMPVGDIRGYEFGTYTSVSGDYAANVLHAMFLPNDPKKHFGVSDMQGTVSGHRVLGVKPEFAWTRYVRNDGDERFNGMELRRMRDAQGVVFENPVCSAQAHGRPGWETNSVNIFADGTFGTLGANTMTNKTHGKIPSHLKPVACAISSSNEFFTVVAWNINTKQSDVAVISLTGLGEGGTIQNPDVGGANGGEGWWGERNEAHPSMHNLGNIAFAKYLGSFPTGLKSATTISFTTGHPRYGYLNGSGIAEGTNGTTGNTARWKASEQQRQDWAVGKFSGRYPRQGLIMVGSKDDQKAVLFDASNLFRYINKMYFTDRATFEQTTNVGQGFDQWPYDFVKAPEQIPTIAKVITTDSPVTSVFLTPISNRVEYYAIYGTAKGDAHVITLGDFPRTIDPTKWVETDTKFVGQNLTWITQVREKAFHSQPQLVADVMQQYIFVSREENAATWIDIYGGKMTVRRTMQDSRIVDMVVVEDYANHGSEQYVLAVGDLEGQAVHNVLWGPGIMHTYDGKPRFDLRPAGAQFMYGGGMKMPGRVFNLAAANIS